MRFSKETAIQVDKYADSSTMSAETEARSALRSDSARVPLGELRRDNLRGRAVACVSLKEEGRACLAVAHAEDSMYEERAPGHPGGSNSFESVPLTG
jgi:hypothetical protein